MKAQRNIFLVGFMGSGKTTVGQLLAIELGRTCFDLDELISESVDLEIREIFEQHGESHFRKLESQCLRNFHHPQPYILALGGGAYQDPANRSLIAERGLSIWLEVSLEEARRRCSGTTERPLQQDRERFEQLYHQRVEIYRNADLRVDTTGKEPAWICREVLGLIADRR